MATALYSFAFSKQKNIAMLNEQRDITSEKVIATLNKNGIIINQQEAEVILDFLYLLAEIIVNEENEK
jgi:hypothetical protein